MVQRSSLLFFRFKFRRNLGVLRLSPFRLVTLNPNSVATHTRTLKGHGNFGTWTSSSGQGKRSSVVGRKRISLISPECTQSRKCSLIKEKSPTSERRGVPRI